MCFCEATQHVTQFQLEDEELRFAIDVATPWPKMMLVLTWHPTGWCWWALARQRASATKSRHGSPVCIFQKYVLRCGTCKQGCREKVWSSDWVKKYNKKCNLPCKQKKLEHIKGRGNNVELVVMQQWTLKFNWSTSPVWRWGSWARTLLGWPARRERERSSFRLCWHQLWCYNNDKASFPLKLY